MVPPLWEGTLLLFNLWTHGFLNSCNLSSSSATSLFLFLGSSQWSLIFHSDHVFSPSHPALLFFQLCKPQFPVFSSSLPFHQKQVPEVYPLSHDRHHSRPSTVTCQLVPYQCLAPPMAIPLAVVRSWVPQAVFIMGKTSRCCMFCLMPQSQVSGSFEYPKACSLLTGQHVSATCWVDTDTNNYCCLQRRTQWNLTIRVTHRTRKKCPL